MSPVIEQKYRIVGRQSAYLAADGSVKLRFEDRIEDSEHTGFWVSGAYDPSEVPAKIGFGCTEVDDAPKD